MRTGDIPLVEIRTQFGKRFPKSTPHHIVPHSRNGPTSHYNLFPYKRGPHSAYHFVFWNMRIDEIWRDLDDIHDAIFDNDDGYIYPFWFKSCRLDRGDERQKARFNEDKRLRLAKRISVARFQEEWFRAFGSASIEHARVELKLMMLHMVFGINMLDVENIFRSSSLVSFFETYPTTGDRLWAFETCFGSGASIHSIKSKTSKIIRKASGLLS